MRERLGHGETAVDRRQVAAEERVRDLVAAARLAPERGLGLVETALVVRDQLGILEVVSSNRLELADAAERVRQLAGKWQVPHGRISFAAYGRRSIIAPPWFMSRQNRIHGSANQNCWRLDP